MYNIIFGEEDNEEMKYSFLGHYKTKREAVRALNKEQRYARIGGASEIFRSEDKMHLTYTSAYGKFRWIYIAS